MIVPMSYDGRSGIANTSDGTQIGFATNTLREATYLRGTLARPVLFREALAAMYHVVVSDYQYHPKDRTTFQAWLAEQDRLFLANLGVKSQKIREQLEVLETQKAVLDRKRSERLKPFHNARRRFFEYLYEEQYELDLLLDPVITVHPDEVSFEAFSRDESAYARLSAPFDQFAKVDGFECGTTNIDFSPRLHSELEKIRSYRQTQFAIEPSGLSVNVGSNPTHKEKKIDLPDSWVRGFHQVQSTMTMGLTRTTLDPADLFNICQFLKRHKTKKSPRALRYEFAPGQRTKVVLEPWNHVIEFGSASKFDGPKPLSIRTWGRNRLLILERLLPQCQKVDVYLAGFGLPSIYVLHLGGLTFTLALSGWTDNDWTGDANFDLLSQRLNANAAELQQTYTVMKSEKRANDSTLATKTGLGLEKCRSSLSYLCRAGRAMFDLSANVYRHRELFNMPFSATEAVTLAKNLEAEANPHEKAAREIVKADNIRIIARRPVSTGYKLSGSAKGADGVRQRPLLHVDHEGKILDASCGCAMFTKQKLTQGPCEHMLVLRLVHMSQLEKEDSGN
jgi:hypothetical protein